MHEITSKYDHLILKSELEKYAEDATNFRLERLVTFKSSIFLDMLHYKVAVTKLDKRWANSVGLTGPFSE